MPDYSFVNIHTHQIFDNQYIEVLSIFADEGVTQLAETKFFSAGLHPWHLQTSQKNDELLNRLKQLFNNKKCVAVGECGLDKICQSDFSEQIRVFKIQVDLAVEIEKPLIIHCVKAYNEVYQIYDEIKPQIPFIFHGYTGNWQTTQQFLSRNSYFSFGKILFNNKAKAVEAFKKLPLEKLLLETDDAEITIEEVYNRAASLKNINLKALKQAVCHNFNNIFQNDLVR